MEFSWPNFVRFFSRNLVKFNLFFFTDSTAGGDCLGKNDKKQFHTFKVQYYIRIMLNFLWAEVIVTIFHQIVESNE